MPKVSKYQASGFFLVNQLEAGGLKSREAAIVSIAKGDALHDDGNGLATNAVTTFTGLFMGIANSAVDNSGDDNLIVQYIPPIHEYRFVVPVAADALVTVGAHGSIVDLEAVGTIDISDTGIGGTSNQWGFVIDEIDVCATAVAVNAYGFAIGHIEKIYTA